MELNNKTAKFDKIARKILSDADEQIRNSLAGVGSSNEKLTLCTADEIIDDLEQRLRQSHCGRPSSSTQQCPPQDSRLVQLVQREMSSEILRELQRHLASAGQPSSDYDSDDVVDECVFSLIQSPKCSSLQEQLKSSIVEQVKSSEVDFSSSFVTESDLETWPVNEHVGRSNAQLPKNQWSLRRNYASDSIASSTSLSTTYCNDVNDVFEAETTMDSSSMGSSINYTHVTCWETLSVERLDRLADSLEASKDWPSRRDALRVLSSTFPMSEVIQSEAWPRLRIRLNELLIFADDRAFAAGLRFHLKMLNSTASLCVVESYASLLEALHTSCSNDGVRNRRRSLRLCELITAFQKVVPRYWTRYPETHIRKMMTHTVLYFLDVTSPSAPLTMAALLDRHAEWFQNWTRGKNVRKIIHQALTTKQHVLRTLVSNCLMLFTNFQEDVEEDASNVSSDTVHQTYSSHQLDYVTSLHVLRIVGHLLSSSDGRAVFEEQVGSAADFVAGAFKVALESCKHVDVCNDFCLATVLVQVLQGLVAREQFWCFSNGCLVSILHEMIIADWLEDHSASDFDLHALDHLTSTLVHVTDSHFGLELTLKTLANDLSRFVERLLLLIGTPLPDDALKTRAVKICCRLLADHGGIVTLNRTSVLFKIAEEWEANLRESECRTPVNPSTNEAIAANVDGAADCWLREMSVIGVTPLGVAALYETNLLQDILIWAERQMNKENKPSFLANRTMLLFLSQVASACDSSCPTLTTHLMPFVNELADRILTATELEVLESEPTIGPPSLERLSATAHGLLSDLVCILPPCQAIRTLLRGRVASGSASTAEHVPFFVKLILSGIQDWSPRAELTCTVGLHLLKLLGTDLNVWLYLETNFHFQETLLGAQKANVEDELSEGLIIDEHFLLRNYFLAKMAEIGGESEKHLPPIDDSQENFPVSYTENFPAITSLPIPQDYLIALGPLAVPPIEVESFLRESTLSRSLSDKEWLVYCREVFRNCIMDRISLRSRWFGDLLYFVIEDQQSEAVAIDKLSFIESDKKWQQQDNDVTSLDNRIGCQLVISYGLRLGLLDDGIKSAQDLMQILNALESGNGSQGFDWATATAYLLLSGDVERTFTFVERLDFLLPHGRMQLSGRNGHPHLDLKSTNVWAAFCHCVEVVLQGDLPLVANAVQRSGMTVGQICRPWISQCFWNVLDWDEICTYIGLYLIMGTDFQVYCVVAIFRHLQKEIIHHVAEDDLPLFIRETRLNRFCTRDHLPFIDHLESKYRGFILSQRS